MNFWDPRRVDKLGNKYALKVAPVACVGHAEHQFFMGGVAMASAISAAEHVTGKPLLWATIQFVSGGQLGDEVELEVAHLGGGRSVAQVGVSLKVDGRMLQNVSAALGARTGVSDEQFSQMPKVPSPSDCPIKQDQAFEQSENLIAQFERRTAFECPKSGIEHMWIRSKIGIDISAQLLAITSDFILGAHRLSRGGTSLDNTLRIFSQRSTEWILCATQLSGISAGTVQGVMQQFAEDGTLLSTSSQTGLLPRIPNS